DAPGRLEILDRMRKAVHPAKKIAASQLRVARSRLGEQVLARQERNDRVDARVQALDTIEIRTHHLDARDLLRPDRARKRVRAEIDDFSGFGRLAHDFVIPPRFRVVSLIRARIYLTHQPESYMIIDMNEPCTLKDAVVYFSDPDNCLNYLV